MTDRAKFYDHIRQHPFNGTMTQKQVDGCNSILDQWDIRRISDDVRWLAYMLATTFWETARTMQPIEEFGKGAGHPYGQPDPVTGQTYYGRGLLQLTWKANYQKMGTKLGVNLVDEPDNALIPS